MSDKVKDLKNDAGRKADDVRDTGEDAVQDVRGNASNRTDSSQGRSSDMGATANGLLASVKDMFNKLKQRVTGGR